MASEAASARAGRRVLTTPTFAGKREIQPRGPRSRSDFHPRCPLGITGIRKKCLRSLTGTARLGHFRNRWVEVSAIGCLRSDNTRGLRHATSGWRFRYPDHLPYGVTRGGRSSAPESPSTYNDPQGDKIRISDIQLATRRKAEQPRPGSCACRGASAGADLAVPAP